VKIHTLLDYSTCLPEFICITDGKSGDATIAKSLKPGKDALIVADRAYMDFKNLFRWNLLDTNFVVRMKSNVKYDSLCYYDVSDYSGKGIVSDEDIMLNTDASYRKYPEMLRRVVVKDDKGRNIEILTNNFNWTATTIAGVYKRRWQIEIFFKEVKQHMRIKAFVGTSENAVLIQIWTALITMLLLRYLKTKAQFPWCMSNLISFLRINLFVKIDLYEWLDRPFVHIIKINPKNNQVALF
jgi:IS4 transposase